MILYGREGFLIHPKAYVWNIISRTNKESCVSMSEIGSRRSILKLYASSEDYNCTFPADHLSP